MLTKTLYDFVFNKVLFDLIDYISIKVLIPIIIFVCGIKNIKQKTIKIGGEELNLHKFIQEILKFIIIISFLKCIF